MVLAGTGKEGKTKEVVKDREGKIVGMYDMYVCMYVCMFVCFCLFVCMFVCMYVRTYVCMYVCKMVGMPRLPRETKVKVDASLCHACHVKRRWM